MRIPLILCTLLLASNSDAAETLSNDDLRFWINNTWMLVAAFMVFLMHLGFAALEAGMTRAKNTVNILFKNISIVAIGLMTYAALGFALMYPGPEFAGSIAGFAGFGIGTDAAGITAAYADGNYTYWTDFIFQAMFAATAATIVSGAVAERIKLGPFLAFATVFVAFCYPIIGMWHWGGGWLNEAGFHDFAGSTIVHAVGGWAALAGIILLGPRTGRFDGAACMAGHSQPLAAIGVFLLWFGWYGFNGGSVLSADPGAVSLVVVTTSLAAAAGVLTAAATSRLMDRRPDLGMALNGALAGLVSITAGADAVTPMSAIMIGAIGGILVFAATRALNHLRLDDPVGAVPVHLVCGIWGTLAVGLFAADKSLTTQLLGVGATAAFAFPAAWIIFASLKRSVGLRVSHDEETIGLDIEEHGTSSYNGLHLGLFEPVSAPRALAKLSANSDLPTCTDDPLQAAG
jgi:Amt family ammonium transporter